jgi:hypothetical protein
MDEVRRELDKAEAPEPHAAKAGAA